MQNSPDEKFENGLKDILTPDDPQSEPPSSTEHAEGKNARPKFQYQTQSTSRQFPLWFETLIRVFAAITAFGLLILFSMRILGR